MHIQGNNEDFSGLEEAENIFVAGGNEDQPLRSGRSLAIEDAILWGTRDGLLGHLEGTWEHVGDKLRTIKTVEDVREAFRLWEKENRQVGKVTQAFFKPTVSAVTAKVLNARRRRWKDSNVRNVSALETRNKAIQSLEVAQRALNSDLSESDKLIVQDQLSKRSAKLAQAEAEYVSAANEQKKLTDLLEDSEAFFARTQFVQFCKSSRYRATPLNTANAMAGLPSIGWRQSVKRCAGKAPQGGNGGPIQVFNTIRRIVESCTRKASLPKHAEQWLKNKGDRKYYGVIELKENWFYLHLAIRTALEAKTRTRDLTFAIAREYSKKKNHPTDVERLFADEERIVD